MCRVDIEDTKATGAEEILRTRHTRDSEDAILPNEHNFKVTAIARDTRILKTNEAKHAKVRQGCWAKTNAKAIYSCTTTSNHEVRAHFVETLQCIFLCCFCIACDKLSLFLNTTNCQAKRFISVVLAFGLKIEYFRKQSQKQRQYWNTSSLINLC